MKKALTAVVVTILTIFFYCTTVFAASATYDLDELGIRISLPSGYKVITRDTPDFDPIYSWLGTTKDDVQKQFEQAGIYLNAISDTYLDEILVIMMDVDADDLNSLDDEDLNTCISLLKETYKQIGINAINCDIYQQKQTEFIRLTFSDEAETVYGTLYYTILDGKAMTFTMRSYRGALTSEQEETMKTIVDGIDFEYTSKDEPKAESKEPFLYTDPDTGTSFTVPANWIEEEISDSSNHIKVKYISLKSDGSSLVYDSTDLLESLPDTLKKVTKRSEVNNSYFTKEDIAEMGLTTADKVSTVTYNGNSYYKTITSISLKEQGLNTTIDMTTLIYIDNGWMHTFQFIGPSDHELESLLNSVQYSGVHNVPLSSRSEISQEIENDDTAEGAELTPAGIVTIIILLAIGIFIVRAIVRSSKLKGLITTALVFVLCSVGVEAVMSTVRQRIGMIPTIILYGVIILAVWLIGKWRKSRNKSKEDNGEQEQ